MPSSSTQSAALPEQRRPLTPYWPAIGSLLLVLLAVAAYLPIARAGYIWDDDDYVLNNVLLVAPGGLAKIWFTLTSTPQYYPMVFTTFWVERRLWGLDPLGYHAVNVLIHGGVAALLWAVLRRLNVPLAFLAAAIFAVHPVHVESVAWITERKNTLSALFYMASLLCYLRFAGLGGPPAGGPRRWAFYGLSLALFVPALLSKTVTCSLPAAIVLILWWKRDRLRIGDIVPLVPMFLLGLLGAGVTSWVERHHVGTEHLDLGLTPVARLLLAGRAAWFYLYKLVYPAELAFIYPKWTIDPGEWRQYLFPAAGAAVLLALWLARRRIGKGPLTAALFFVGTLVPALGFVDVYPMEFSWVADHFQYLASIGPIALASAGVAAVVGGSGAGGVVRPPRPGTWTGVCAVAVGMLGLLTARQTLIYENVETLWRDTIRKNPAGLIARNNLAKALLEQGRTDEAIAEFERALEVDPGYALALYNLAAVHYGRGDASRADGYARRALAAGGDSVAILSVAGRIAHAMGRAEEAADHFHKAAELQGNSVLLRLDAAELLAACGRYEQAAAHLELALRDRAHPSLTPTGLVQGLTTLGSSLRALGRHQEAAERLREALKLRPGHPPAQHQLALCLASLGQTQEAVELARAAAASDPRNPDILTLMGRLLASRPGGAEEARRWLIEAVRVEPDHPGANLSLARLSAAQGLLQEASVYYRTVLRKDPSNTEAARAIEAIREGRQPPPVDPPGR